MEKKTPAEYYYLALYYSSMGQYKKSENYLEKIYDKYSLSDKLRELVITSYSIHYTKLYDLETPRNF